MHWRAVITTDHSFSECGRRSSDPLTHASMCRQAMDAMMTTALLDRHTHSCHILETSNDSYLLKASSEASAKTTKEATTLTKA